MIPTSIWYWMTVGQQLHKIPAHFPSGVLLLMGECPAREMEVLLAVPVGERILSFSHAPLLGTELQV